MSRTGFFQKENITVYWVVTIQKERRVKSWDSTHAYQLSLMGELAGDDQNREKVDMSAPRCHTPKRDVMKKQKSLEE